MEFIKQKKLRKHEKQIHLGEISRRFSLFAN